MNKQPLDDEQLQHLLHSPIIPHDLEQQLQANFAQQLMQKNHTTSQYKRFALAASVILVISVLFLSSFWIGAPTHSPLFIRSAVAHIGEETHLAGELTPLTYGLKQYRLHLPLEQATLSMIKDCWVDGRLVKHLRFQYPDGVVIELMLSPTPFPQGVEPDCIGQHRHLHWLSLQPRSDLFVLAFYQQQPLQQRAITLVSQLTEVSHSINP
ncbi:hypothetical protein [Candidatus Albibeggiatoa sp. nov. BB20]|uniref:hypothetical protein n=1 Tax=Candidatus Albibeggiatoa sp. nov. BB20 TaxID=3162723 RepID=UPI003365966D